MATLTHKIVANAVDLIPRATSTGKASYQDSKNFRAHCTLQTCSLKLSYWGYRPSAPANAFFLACFALSTLLFLAQGAYSRRFIGFTIAMVCGCVLEVLGYVGRVLAYNHPFDENPFLIQIVCLTIAPAFLAAGIYLCLSRIVVTFGPENSRIKPLSYPRIFIPCDVASLVLQALGGGMASVATHTNRSAKTGNNIMIAGLAVQVVTLFIFICLALDFALRTLRRTRQLGKENALDPRHAKLRQSLKFKAFLVALSLATLCIFTRCVYRVAELSEGWTGHLILTQKYFIGLESAVVAVAVLLLNAAHPGLCFQEGYADGHQGCCSCCGRRKKKSLADRSEGASSDEVAAGEK